MAEVIEFKARPKAKTERIEYKPNWGMMGAILFCLGFWAEVFRWMFTGHF